MGPEAALPGEDALLDHLVKRALEGERTATLCLLEALPPQLPARIALRFRNSEIRTTATWLRTVVPGISERRIAKLLEAAGDAIATRRGLALLPEGSVLTRQELGVLRGRLEPFVGRSRCWPRQRMLRAIVSNEGGQ